MYYFRASQSPSLATDSRLPNVGGEERHSSPALLRAGETCDVEPGQDRALVEYLPADLDDSSPVNSAGVPDAASDLDCAVGHEEYSLSKVQSIAVPLSASLCPSHLAHRPAALGYRLAAAARCHPPFGQPAETFVTSIVEGCIKAISCSLQSRIVRTLCQPFVSVTRAVHQSPLGQIVSSIAHQLLVMNERPHVEPVHHQPSRVGFWIAPVTVAKPLPVTFAAPSPSLMHYALSAFMYWLLPFGPKPQRPVTNSQEVTARPSSSSLLTMQAKAPGSKAKGHGTATAVNGKRIFFIRAALWIIGFGLLAQTAQAAVQTQVISVPTVSWQGATYDVNGNLISAGNYSSFSGSYSYNLFDPALGTLTGADICVSVTGTGNSMSDYYNWAGATNLPTISVSRQQGIGFSLSGGNGFLDAGYSPLYNPIVATGAQNFTTSTTAAYGTWKSSPGDYASAALNYNQSKTAPNISSFAGPGSASFDVSAWIVGSNSYNPTPPGGADVTADKAVNTHWESQSWTMTVTIRYTYSPSCTMSGMTFTSSACNNNGTPSNSSDDYYTSNITVAYSNKPTTGTLDLTGAGIHSGSYSVAVGSIGASSYTFSGVKLMANGSAPSVNATFSAVPSCTVSGSAPSIASCSVPPCTMSGITASAGTCNSNGTPNSSTDDYYVSTVTVNFSNRPTSGTLSLSGSAIHSGSYSVNATSTSTSTSHTFANVWLKANATNNDLTASFSADPACSITTTSTNVASCSFPCSMSSISASTGSCYDNGTPSDSSDDYYFSTVTINFSNRPTTGSLSLSGTAIHSGSYTVGTTSTTNSTTHIFNNVKLRANSVANALTASFSADPACTATTTSTSATSCSIPPCSMTGLSANSGTCNNNGTANITTDDYYLSTVTVSFTSRPSSGTLSLSGSAIHSGSFSINAISTTTSTSHTFTTVKMKADGTSNTFSAAFSADPSCTYLASAPVVSNCSTPPPGCAISSLVASSGTCDDNGTPSDSTDDFYASTVTVTFSNPPTTGNLSLSGAAIASGSYSVPATNTSTGTSHTFTNVYLKANGVANSLSATFGADPACTLSTTGTAKASCSVPPIVITAVGVGASGSCNNNGTPSDSTDDYYLATVTIEYNNRPSSGTLALSGVAIHPSNTGTISVGVTSIGLYSYSFVNVWLKANGVGNTLTATFSVDPGSAFSTTDDAYASCSAPVCTISAVSPSAGTCNNNSTPADSSDDYYLSNVTVSFSNRPTGNTLTLTGAAIHSGNYSIAANSTTAPSYTFTGVKLRANGVANALIATFNADPACTFTNTATALSSCSVPICPSITVATPTNLPPGLPGVSYGPVNFTASGGSLPYTWTVSPALPAGLSLSSAGLLNGTPTGASTNTYTFTVRDSTSGLVCTATKVLDLTIGCPIVTVIPPTTDYPWCAVGQPYPPQQFVSIGGTAPYTWSIVPPIDALTINSSGLLSGTIVNAGTFTSQIVATDANGCTASTTFSTINSNCPEEQTINPGKTFKLTVQSGIVSAIWLRNTGNGPNPIPGATNLSYTVSTPGDYSWIGIDGDGCLVESCCVVKFKNATSCSIGNLVWEDCNNNGLKDANESGLAGATVRLYTPGNDNAVGGSGANADTQYGPTLVTDASGAYKFTDLPPGKYFVRVTPPASNWKTGGTVTNLDNRVDNDNNGNQPTGTGGVLNSPVIDLALGAEPIIEDGDPSSDLTVDFGIWPGYKVGDLVWEDENNDGIRQLSEAVLPGITVALVTTGNDNAIGGVGAAADTSLLTTTTSANGTFCFYIPVSGYYYLRLTPVVNYPAPSSIAFGDNGINDVNKGTQPAGLGTPVYSPVFRLLPCTEPGSTGTGNQELTIDFGMRLGALAVGNLVFEDINNNLIADPGEGIAGTRVRLYNVGKVPGTDPYIEEQTTSATGKFLFSNLLPGQYFLHLPSSEFSPPRPLTGLFSLPGVQFGDDNGGDSSIDENRPWLNGISTGTITLAKGTQPTDAGTETGTDYAEDNSAPYIDNNTDLTQDFGLYRRVSLGNLVFFDANSNGHADPGEGVPGVTVELYSTTQTPGVSTPLSSTVTDANGLYLLNATAGAYRVFIPKTMFQSGAPLFNRLSIAQGQFGDDNVGEDGLNDTNPVTSGVATATVSIYPGVAPTASNGETGTDSASDDVLDSAIDLTIDFGFQRPIGIGNLVFFEANNNGHADTGEGVANVTVQLYENGATPGSNSPLQSTTTNANGHYLFTGLAGGTYFVFIPQAEFGPNGHLSGKVSMNGSAAPGTDDSVGEDGLNGGSPISAGVRTASTTFTAGSLPVDGANGENGYLASEDNTNDADTDLTIDLGFTLPDPNNVGVGNLVYNDLNGNKIADPGEGIDGVWVLLYQSSVTNPDDTNYVTSTTTSGGGNYYFTNLAPGSYYIVIPAVNWWPVVGKLNGKYSIPGQGKELDDNGNPLPHLDDNYDENGDDPINPSLTGVRSSIFTLTADSEPTDFDSELGNNTYADDDDDDNNDLTIDFGFYTPVGVGNLVFLDTNGNGHADAGEGVGNVKVELWNLAINPFEPIATQTTVATGSNKGKYMFTNLTPGTYYLQIPPSEFNSPGGHLVGRSVFPTAQISGDDNLGQDGISILEPQYYGIRTADFDLIPGSEPYGTTQEGGLFNGDDSPTNLGDKNYDLTQDFGFVSTINVGNLVFIDIDQDGKYTEGTDTGIDGVAIEIYRQDSPQSTPVLVDSTTTADGGKYNFAVPAGTYFVKAPASNFTPGSGLLANTKASNAATQANINQDDHLSQDATDAGDPTTNGAKTATFVLASGTQPTAGTGETGFDSGSDDGYDADSNLTIDLGFQPLALGVGNLVFKDINGNGKFDQGTDTPCVGVTIQLYDSFSLPGSDPYTDSTVTASDGTYRLKAYAEGDYVIYIPPTEFGAGKPLNGLVSVTSHNSANSDDNLANSDNGLDASNPASSGIYSTALSLYYGAAPINSGLETGYLASSDNTAPDIDSNTNLTIDFGFVPAPPPSGLRVTKGLITANSTASDAESQSIQSDASDSTQVVASAPDTFIAWQKQHSLNGDNAAADNPDADFYTNLMEYALGTEPGTDAQPSAPRFRLIASSKNATQPMIELTRPSAGHLDLQYSIETATQPAGPWSALPATAFTTSQNNDGTETLRLADLHTAFVNLSEQSSTMLARLEITLDADHNGTPEATAKSPVWAAHQRLFPAAQSTFAMPLLPPTATASTPTDAVSIKWTLDTLFPPSAFHSASSATAADTIHLFDGSSYRSYWLYRASSGTASAHWVAKANTTLSDSGGTVLARNEGVIVQPRSSAITQLFIGQVASVKPSLNLTSATQLLGTGELIATSASEVARAAGPSSTALQLRFLNSDSTPGQTGTTSYDLLSSPPLLPFRAYFIMLESGQ